MICVWNPLLGDAAGDRGGIRMKVPSVTQHTVISLRYGLGDEEPMTLEAISKSMGCTRERVRQIKGKALAKLRKRAKISNEITEGGPGPTPGGVQVLFRAEHKRRNEPNIREDWISGLLGQISKSIISLNWLSLRCARHPSGFFRNRTAGPPLSLAGWGGWVVSPP